MPFSTIDDPKKYFDTKLYTGTGSTLSINGINFSPDLVWVKRRNTTGGNKLTDTVRGAGIVLVSNATDAEFSQTGISSFNSDGFTVGTDSGDFNASGGTYASWNWRGSDSSAVSNTSGTISSTVSANPTSGFSIVSYTGNGTSGATVGHGIGSTVGMILVKGRSFVDNWAVYHKSIGGTGLLELNGTGGTNTVSTRWNNTNAGATVFTLGNNSQVNGSGSTYIAYCFAEVKGFSKFGSYTGNGSTNGTFVYTGFTPAFVLVKNTTQASSWILFDNKRSSSGGSNAIGYSLKPNVSNAEDTGAGNILDFVSNGFKIRSDGVYEDTNGSGQSIIYMAFASNPFVSSKGIAVTAR